MVQVSTSPPGVSNWYIFKSRLQEYAQKVQLSTPVYETIKEGPSHQPSFKSTVIVNGVRYDSLPGFLNRKAAEQSAAEIALTELSKLGESKEPISVPVHETGLCKNLLQDYTQKMNYALPTYIWKRDDTPGKSLPFSCTVEIGGMQYIGATAKTKKEAEIKAARTALLAIRSSPSSVASENLSIKSQYLVVPPKRKVPDTAPSQMTEKTKKPKKSRFKKKQPNPRRSRNVGEQIQHGSLDVLASNDDKGTTVEVQQAQDGLSEVQVPKYGQTFDYLSTSAQDIEGSFVMNQHIEEAYAVHGGLVPKAPGCQQLIDGNIMSAVSSTSSTHGNRDPGVADMTLPSGPFDASASDLKIGLGEVAMSTIETNPENEQNTLVTIVAPVISDPLPTLESDAPVSETVIGQGGSTSATTDPNNEKDKNSPATNVAPVISELLPTLKFDASVTETVN